MLCNNEQITTKIYSWVVQAVSTIRSHQQLNMNNNLGVKIGFFLLSQQLKVRVVIWSRRIYRGAVNLFLFRHCPSKIFWKCTIWNINIQYKNDWYTLQKWTKPVFAFRHWDNLVSSSIYPSCISLHINHVDP